MHNLMGHMHLHSDSKPFKCLYCPSKFTLKGNLTRHMKVKHGVMDRGLDERLFRQRGRLLLAHFSQEQPFDLSQKSPTLAGLRLPQSDGESVPGSSCQEEDEESLYRRSQYSPEVEQQEVEVEVEAESPREVQPTEAGGSDSPAEELSEHHHPAGVRLEGAATLKSDLELSHEGWNSGAGQRSMYSYGSKSEDDAPHPELDDSDKKNQEEVGDSSNTGEKNSEIDRRNP